MEENQSFSVGNFAQIDGSRRSRIGMPEAIYTPHKTVVEIIKITHAMVSKGNDGVLATRCSPEVVEALKAEFGFLEGFAVFPSLDIASSYRSVVIRTQEFDSTVRLRVAILCAGTSDLRVAWECSATLLSFGVKSEIIADVGVAGLDRTMRAVERASEFAIVVVVAGMEGAIASVVGGLVSQPVIAVPTSTGYGSSLEGITALLAMTASCAQGVTVVGIDNGFGAACAAFRITNFLSRKEMKN